MASSSRYRGPIARLIARAPRFDDSCLVETNDVSLANVWLDQEAQAALLASRYVSGTPEGMRTTVPMLRDGAWQHEVRSDEVSAFRTGAETNPERITDMLAASFALARRPVRWAKWFGPIAKRSAVKRGHGSKSAASRS